MNVQRWELGRHSFRPAGETIRTSDYEVGVIDRAGAKAFVIAHHYAKSFPAARFNYGLFKAGRLMGVATFSHPCNDSVLTSVFPGTATDSTELGRFVLLDEVPGNGETWFLSRSFKLLAREGIRGVVSFSDPVPRASVDGAIVLPGHVGTIYQAHNGVYLGRGKARTLRLLPDGTVMSDRAISKIRARERGFRYSAAILEAHGADALERDEDPRSWLGTWLPQLTRRLAHPGNHKYAWPLGAGGRNGLPPSAPYPKTLDVEVA